MDKIRIGGTTWVEITQFAEANNVTIQTVYNWIKSGKVEKKTFFGKTLIKL